MKTNIQDFEPEMLGTLKSNDIVRVENELVYKVAYNARLENVGGQSTNIDCNRCLLAATNHCGRYGCTYVVADLMDPLEVAILIVKEAEDEDN